MNADPLPFPARRRGPGRPRLEEEVGSPWRALAGRAFALRYQQPRLSWQQIARRLFVDDSTLSRYRTRFVQLHGDPYQNIAELLRVYGEK